MVYGVGRLVDAVRRALDAVPHLPVDEAAAALAVRYAEQVDDGEAELVKAGPGLLACLAELGMTPRSRKALVKEATDGPASPLDELRQRRTARAAG